MLYIDDAEKFTSEMHDPCTRQLLPERENNTETPSRGTGLEPAKHPPKIKLEMFLQLQSAREELVTRTFL